MSYGFYSAEAERAGMRVFIYESSAGLKRCTCVDPDPEAPGYAWADKVNLGTVRRFIRRDDHDT